MSIQSTSRREEFLQLVGKSVANGKYRITGLLGFGGMGPVYEATQVAMDRRVALKLIAGHDPKHAMRFKREAMTVSKLRHPNTVTVFDYGETEDRLLYLAMELLDGQTLGDVIRAEAPMEPKRAAHIASQICRSLQEAHEAGIVHRDIKPDNIMLIRVDRDTDFVKVLDFGIAKALQEQDVNITGDGRIVGTPRYMSPEQIRAENLDPRSDLYSLGCILFEMLCGAPPFGQSSVTALMIAHTQDAPPSFSDRLGTRAAMFPAQLEPMVRRMLEKSPDHRPSSADALRSELDLLVSSPAQAWNAGFEADEHDRTAPIVIDEVLREDQKFSTLSGEQLVVDFPPRQPARNPHPATFTTSGEFLSPEASQAVDAMNRPSGMAPRIAVGVALVAVLLLGAMATLKHQHETRLAEAEALEIRLAEEAARREEALELARLEEERRIQARREASLKRSQELAEMEVPEPKIIPRSSESNTSLDDFDFDVDPNHDKRTKLISGVTKDLFNSIMPCNSCVEPSGDPAKTKTTKTKKTTKKKKEKSKEKPKDDGEILLLFD